MIKIGLTGGIASGKSTVANLFAKQGISIIDTDVIAREVVNPGTDALQQIIQCFGKTILDENQNLDRHKLREIVFADPKARNWLENLLHPLIREAMLKQAGKVKSKYCILVIPLLKAKDQFPYLDRILVVDSSEQQQIQRVMQRDHCSKEHAQSIINTQISRQQRLALADDVIANNGDIQQLEKQVEKLHRKYMHLANYSSSQNK